MHRHPLNQHLLLGTILPIHLQGLQVSQHPQTLLANYMFKDGILAIEMRGGGKEDKKLRAVGFGAFVGHGHDAAGVVAQRRSDFVGEGGVPDGGAAFGGRRRGEEWVARARQFGS
ncbi:hypothetical protein BOTCAL_0082g00090 [Botryotinia calthae]|uniref:Uncharacterized protein n=1 Tax=Botryotinia calthae TaxID=38488 RepID=A0A4Y8D7S1_9HELO|nr:hypothetical protein BOTCAL_0082g00090 [Botryotinia calthae]